MKRRWFFISAALALLTGFTLYTFEVQTSRFQWNVAYQGAAYNTAVPEETNFRHCLSPSGFTDVFGYATYRTAGLQCSWSAAGTLNGGGGTNGVWVKIVHEDAGIDCQCQLGQCNAAASTEMGCTCADGGYGASSGVQLGRTVLEDGGEQAVARLCVQVDDLTDCAANPSGLSCSIDLFR